MRNGLIWLISISLLFITTVQASSISDTLGVPEVTIKTSKLYFSNNSIQFDSSRLAMANAQTLSRFLQENSSVQFKTYGTSGSAVISIRGANSSHSKIVWNGMSLGSPMLNMNDVSLLSTNNGDDIQLIKGGSTAINGNSALSGIISLINKENFNSKSVQVGLNYSSLNNTDYQVKFTLAGENLSSQTAINVLHYKNNFSFNNRAEFGNPKQKQLNSDWNQFSIIQSFFLKFNKVNIDWHHWLQESDRELSPAIYNRTHTNYQLDKSYRTVTNVKYDVNSNNKLVTNIGFTREQLRYVNRIALNSQSFELFKTRSYFDQLQLQLSWNHINSKIIQESTVQYVFDGAYVEDYFQYRKRNKLALISNTKFSPSTFLNVSFSNRAELLNADLYYASSVLINTNQYSKNGFLPYLKLSKNYNLPGLNDLYWVPGGNPNLKAEKSWEQEIGFNYHKKIKSFEFKTNFDVYHSLVSDWILWQPSAIENGIWTPQNLVEVKLQGLEIDQEFSYHKNSNRLASLKIFYAYNQAINNKAVNVNDLSVGKQLIYVPIEKMGLNFSYAFSKYSALINYHRVSHRYTTSDHSEFLPAYQLFDIRVQKTFELKSNSIISSIYIDNLFNVSYESIPFQAMPARVFGVNLKYQFHNKKRNKQ